MALAVVVLIAMTVVVAAAVVAAETVAVAAVVTGCGGNVNTDENATSEIIRDHRRSSEIGSGQARGGEVRVPADQLER